MVPGILDAESTMTVRNETMIGEGEDMEISSFLAFGSKQWMCWDGIESVAVRFGADTAG